MENENVYEKIFFVFGIIAFAMLIVWLGYKLIQVIKRTILNNPQSAPSFLVVPSTAFGEMNETQNINRMNHLIQRCSETGFLRHKLNSSSKR